MGPSFTSFTARSGGGDGQGGGPLPPVAHPALPTSAPRAEQPRLPLVRAGLRCLAGLRLGCAFLHDLDRAGQPLTILLGVFHPHLLAGLQLV